MVANPFGRAAFDQGDPSRVTVAPGESLRLSDGVLVHDGAVGEKPDLAQAFERYLELAEE
jgi:hypothetical protein